MKSKIRVGIIGVGNCASALVQGVSYYGSHRKGAGLMHPLLGGYAVGDIEFSAAFDIAHGKVGSDLSQAIFAQPNNTAKFASVAHAGVRVLKGPRADGVGKYLQPLVPEARGKEVDVAQVLRRTRTEVVVLYLPVGAEMACRWYAKQVLEAGCALINCIPVFIASDPKWVAKFAKRKLPLIGDDIKSQVGATIVHRMLSRLFAERGVRMESTYQLNFGGNTDFLNMLERERLESKKISKTRSVLSQIGNELGNGHVHIGPSDHVPWLGDRKWCYIRLEGVGFGGLPLQCELKLEVWDSPNSAGVVIDAIRCARLALDRGIGGVLHGPSSYYMKSPPQQFSDEEARLRTEAFIVGKKEGAR